MGWKKREGCMKTVAIIQARMGSTRLPGKVLMPLDSRFVLSWVVRACCAAPGIGKVLIATSTSELDDVIAQQFGIRCFRGSETDVLSRFVGAAEGRQADIILRITGDCPFIDPQVIGAVVRLQKQTGAAYVSNVDPRTYPDGLDVECFTAEALFAAHHEATRPIDRDTVTYWIRRNQSRFPAESVINPIPGLEKERWVLDTKEDYEFCKAIAERWPWHKGPPSQLDILNILDKEPELRKLNTGHIMNERFYDALAEEPVYRRTYSRSVRLLALAETRIPLGAQTFSKSKLQFPQPSPLFVTHGQGGLVWDADGNEYVDTVSALLPNILGYRDPDVDTAIRRQLARGISFSLATELEAELAETLVRLIPCAEMVRFGKTGSDATSAAIRLARAYRNNAGIIIAADGYHGWHDWAVTRTSRGVGVPQADICRITRDEILDWDLSRWGAVIIEPESDPAYLRELRAACDKTGCILIFDEVITGFRFDLGGAQKLWNVTPDLACFGKSMANGMPLSAVVGKKEIMSKMIPPDNIFFSGTFFGETLSLAAAIATIKKLEKEDVVNGLWLTGGELWGEAYTRIKYLGLETTVMLHGSSPLARLKFKDSRIAALFRKEMIATGTLIIASHNICAAHGPSEIKRILKSYDHTLSVIKEAIEKGDVEKRLEGARVEIGVRA